MLGGVGRLPIPSPLTTPPAEVGANRSPGSLQWENEFHEHDQKIVRKMYIALRYT